METIILTRQQMLKKYSELEPVSCAIKLIEEKYWKKGKVVCDIYLDDVLLSEDSLFRKLPLGSSDYKQVKICVEDLHTLVTETIGSTKEHIKKVFNFTESTLEKYSNEDYNHALRDFADIMDNAKHIYECILLINEQVHRKSKENSENILSQWDTLEKKIVSMINELTTSFSTEDYILQADVLEYEFLEVLNGCHDYLEVIEEKIKVMYETV